MAESNDNYLKYWQSPVHRRLFAPRRGKSASALMVLYSRWWTIGRHQVNETLDTADGKFDGVQAPTALQFPLPLPDPAQSGPALQTAQSDAQTNRMLAYAGIARSTTKPGVHRCMADALGSRRTHRLRCVSTHSGVPCPRKACRRQPRRSRRRRLHQKPRWRGGNSTLLQAQCSVRCSAGWSFSSRCSGGATRLRCRWPPPAVAGSPLRVPPYCCLARFVWRLRRHRGPRTSRSGGYSGSPWLIS